MARGCFDFTHFQNRWFLVVLPECDGEIAKRIGSAGYSDVPKIGFGCGTNVQSAVFNYLKSVSKGSNGLYIDILKRTLGEERLYRDVFEIPQVTDGQGNSLHGDDSNRASAGYILL